MSIFYLFNYKKDGPKQLESMYASDISVLGIFKPQCAERILTKIAKAINVTFAGSKVYASAVQNIICVESY